MRTGLVALGTGFLALAVAGAVALFLIPIAAPQVTSTTTWNWAAPPGGSNSTEIPGGATVQGILVVHWQSHLPLDVRVWRSQGCEPGVAGCPAWQLALNLSDESSGNFTLTAPLHFPVLFSWSDPTSDGGAVTMSAATTTQGQASLAPLSQLLLGLGVGALGFVGGVTLFLGLFLRGGIYDATRPPPIRVPADHVPEDPPSPRPPVH